MASYSVGDETKENILAAARKLFYEKGYVETTYADLCEYTGIRQGNLHYHFNSKMLLAKTICLETGETINAEASALLGEEGDPILHYVLCMFIFWYKFYNDPKYRRFIYQATLEIVTKESPEEYFNIFFGKFGLIEDYNNKFNKINIMSCMAIDSVLPSFIINNLDKYTYEEMSEYTLTIYCLILGINQQKLKEAIIKSVEIMRNADLSKLDSTL